VLFVGTLESKIVAAMQQERCKLGENGGLNWRYVGGRMESIVNSQSVLLRQQPAEPGQVWRGRSFNRDVFFI
jgi:hypothetical protein